MQEQMCQSCVRERLGVCWFKITTDQIINALHPSNEQTLIAGNTTITNEAVEANKTIAANRIRARDERLCPQPNYNPQNLKFQPNL